MKDMADSIQYGHTASAVRRESGPRFLRITDIQDGRVDWSAVPSCDIPKDDLAKYKLAPGDLVFARTGATTGKSFLIGECPEAVFASYLIRVRVSVDVDSRYLATFFQSPDYWRQIEGGKRGIGQPNVNGKVLGEIQFPLAPLPEQRRIVAEIEKQFTRLEAGVAALRRVQANLKRYRAAVLKAACEGKLVPTEAELSRSQPPVAPKPREGGSTKNPQPAYETGEQLLKRILAERRKKWTGRGRYKEPAAPDTANLPPLPEGWTWATAEQLTDEDRAITYGVIKLGATVPDGLHVLRSSDVRHLRLDLQDVKRVSPDIARQYRRTFLKGGEVLITVRGTLGGVVVAPAECAGFNISREVAMLAMVQPALAKIAAIFIGSAPLQRWLLQRAKGIAYTGINIETLKQLPIPFSPLAEQTRILAEVERRLSMVGELQEVVSVNLQRATRLRQSILQKAYTGELC